jgi:hypothetical protein
MTRTQEPYWNLEFVNFSSLGYPHYYEKHLLGRVKTHFLGRVAHPLLVFAAKNAYLQGRVAKPPLKIGFLGRANPPPTRPYKSIFRGGSPPCPTL